jgi:hypothetical protein
MSLLGSQVYANNAQNLWFPVTGGTIKGNVLVGGNFLVGGTTTLQGATSVDASLNVTGGINLIGGSNFTTLTTDAGGDSMALIATNNITFGRDGVAPNTTLAVSAPGANLDLLTTNFLRAIGPVPTNLISASKTINPVPTSPATPFIVDTAFPVASGQVYDVQATGVITLASGTPNAADAIIIALDAGTGTSVTSYTYYPSGAGQSGNWSIRQRIVGNATQASLAVAVNQLLAGGSTAVYSATMNYFSAVRVA